MSFYEENDFCSCGAELLSWEEINDNECNACSLGVDSGDYIRDPLDSEIREVSYVAYGTIYFVDGGLMSVNEVSHNDIYLPSEVA